MDLPAFADLLGNSVNAKTLLMGVLGLLLLGATPRVGLVRALTLGWRSTFTRTTPQSVRTAEIVVLQEDLQSLEKGQYVTVIGGKGNGKSRLIDTTLNHTFGVIKTSVTEKLFFINSPLLIINIASSVSRSLVNERSLVPTKMPSSIRSSRGSRVSMLRFSNCPVMLNECFSSTDSFSSAHQSLLLEFQNVRLENRMLK